MDLWIRSQDREALTKVNMGIMYWKDTDDRDCIVNKDNATGYSILAEYKTKERALEVIDEIQEAQLGNYHYRCPSNVKVSNNENTIVYQMPEK